METTLKSTPLTRIHEELGAKMVEYAGYNMPVSYSGIIEEHATVRDAVGMFDVSHMGEFILKGPNALDLIQRVTSNDASKLEPGKAQYSCLPNTEGGIVDDLLVYDLGSDMDGQQAYMLVVNAANMEKDWNWIQQFNTATVEMHNISDKTALLAVQGPNATKTLRDLTSMDLDGMGYYTFEKGTFAGVNNVLVSATGYTGSGGFEIYFENEHAPAIWEAIITAGAPHGLKPIGLGARDTLRLEMGFCLYGNDINDTTSPLEAGLGWITKLAAKEFNSSQIFKDQKEAGLTRKLVGFEMIDKGIPRHGYELRSSSGEKIGEVTSGTQSAYLGKAIGMGYVTPEQAAADTEIKVVVRERELTAKVVKLPFYKPQ
jgi:aminomethyltransferase